MNVGLASAIWSIKPLSSIQYEYRNLVNVLIPLNFYCPLLLWIYMFMIFVNVFMEYNEMSPIRH